LADRAATKEEVAACRQRLDSIIYAVDPRLIFTLGDMAWKAMVKPKDRDGKTSLDKAVGNLVMTYIPGTLTKSIGYPVLPLLSLKQILASPSMAKHGTIAVTLKHLQMGKSYVHYLKKTEQGDRDIRVPAEDGYARTRKSQSARAEDVRVQHS
jgi:uracil-DNA glycosylase